MAQHRSSTSTVTMLTTPHTSHARIMSRESRTMKKIKRRQYPMKEAAAGKKATPNITPAAAAMMVPARVRYSSRSSCAFWMASSTVAAASSSADVVEEMPVIIDIMGSSEASVIASLMSETSSARSEMVSAMAWVRSLAPETRLGASAKMMNAPTAVTTTNAMITILFWKRSFFVNARGLYAPLQNLHAIAPQTEVTRYTMSMRIM